MANALSTTRRILLTLALALAAVGVLDAILFEIYTQAAFALVLAAAAVRAREPGRAPVKVIMAVGAIQGLVVVAFLLFGDEDLSVGETAVAGLLVVASACTVASAMRELRSPPAPSLH